MNENEFPDNKTIVKRVGSVLIILAVIVALICAKEHIFTIIYFLVAVFSIFLIVLFIRLCVDVHSIAKNIDKISMDVIR